MSGPVDPNLFRQLDQALAKLPDDQTPTSQPDPTAPTSASGLCDLLDFLDTHRTKSDKTITSDDVNDLHDSLVKASGRNVSAATTEESSGRPDDE